MDHVQRKPARRLSKQQSNLEAEDKEIGKA